MLNIFNIKVLKEHLLLEFEHPTIYDEYTFDGFNFSEYNNTKYVFLDNSKKSVNTLHSDIEYLGNDVAVPMITLINDDDEYKIPQWDETGRDILKISKNGNLFLLEKDFKKYVPNYEVSTKKMSISDVAAKIKNERKFLSLINIVMENIYSNLTTEDGEPMFGESVKDDRCKTNRGVINFKGIKYGKDNSLVSNWSILNYFNTNSKVIQYVLKLFIEDTGYTLSDFSEEFSKTQKYFLDWVRDNQDDIFGPESVHLDNMEKINLTSLSSGIEREQVAVGILLKLHSVGEEGITEYCPGSIEDTKYGRDLKINSEPPIYYQIKPLNGDVKETENGYAVPTHSMKKYPNTVDRLLFVGKGNRYAIFENNNYVVSAKGDLVTFKKGPINGG